MKSDQDEEENFLNNLYDTPSLSITLLEKITKIIEEKCNFKRVQFYKKSSFLVSLVSLALATWFIVDVNRRDAPFNRSLYLLVGIYSLIWLVAGSIAAFRGLEEKVEFYRNIKNNLQEVLSISIQSEAYSSKFVINVRDEVFEKGGSVSLFKKKIKANNNKFYGSFEDYFYDDGRFCDKSLDSFLSVAIKPYKSA